jgi:hypothetical protein
MNFMKRVCGVLVGIALGVICCYRNLAIDTSASRVLPLIARINLCWPTTSLEEVKITKAQLYGWRIQELYLGKSRDSMVGKKEENPAYSPPHYVVTR